MVDSKEEVVPDCRALDNFRPFRNVDSTRNADKVAVYLDHGPGNRYAALNENMRLDKYSNS